MFVHKNVLNINVFLLLMECIVWAFLGPANVNLKKKSEIEKTKLFSCEKLTV